MAVQKTQLICGFWGSLIAGKISSDWKKYFV